ncbi:MAG: hypothetical protein OEY14_15440, partial [Myxococcales bacterium]|nr:hypothetical protein [Myxococcales bacterium]
MGSSLLTLTLVARADPPLLHEFVPDVRGDELSSLVTGGGAEPSAIVYEGELLPPPPGGVLRSGERSMRARQGTGAAGHEAGLHSPSFRPDRITSLEGELD